MKKNGFIKCIIIINIMIIALIVSCDFDNSSAPDTTVDSISESIAGTLLTSVAVENGQVVRFYELREGVVGIRESLDLSLNDSPAVKLEDMCEPGKSLSDIYQALFPGSKVNVPEVLVEAQKRIDLKNLEIIALEESIAQGKIPAPVSAEKEKPAAESAGTRAGCTPDYYNDNYGANWFLNRYCVEGSFRHCSTNRTWSYSGLYNSSWYKTSAMAPDFETGVRFRGWYWYWASGVWPWFSGEWMQILDWDYTVLPRHVETWVYSGSGYRESRADGIEPCRRVHFSALRN